MDDYTIVFIFILKKMRKSRNPQNDERFNLELILNLQDEGKNVKEISEIIGINKKTLDYRLKKLGIRLNTLRDRYQKNHQYFDNIDTEVKSYLLGFIVADGCIRETRTKKGNITKCLTFCNSINDLEVINLIQKELGLTIPIRHSVSSFGKEVVHYTITSTYLVDCLINKYLIIPNKTLDINFKFPLEKIPENLIRHFIRGFFDGDGTINNYTNQKTKRIGFVFTSKIFMDQINEILKNKIPDIHVSIQERKGKTTTYYVTNISLGGEKIKKLFDFFYLDSTVFLSRKKIRF